MTKQSRLVSTVRGLRAKLSLTQEQLGQRLGVSANTVNRWEGGLSEPQRAAWEAIQRLAEESGLDSERPLIGVSGPTARPHRGIVPSTKSMEQMLWDAACSIRGEKDAAKFKDFLLPLLFLKRLSDVFDDEIERLTDSFGDREKALQMAELDHSLLRFYVPPVARWAAISGREAIEWPEGERPRDIGEHLTTAVRAVAKQNPALAGVIDVEDFDGERNGERDINPSKLRGVVETLSDPRYRLGIADVEPDFLGRCYEYLLRKFAEGSGQSAGEFFTPTNVGFMIAQIMRPMPGEECHDYACGSAGLLIKLQLVARELDPLSKVPLRLYGQELQAESFAVAKMNGIIHDMDIEMMRGDSMINPKYRNADGSLRKFDIVVANPMWNQAFAPEIYDNDQFDRFREAGGITSGKGDWAWLQQTLACMNDRGRAAVVLDTGAVTRGSGSKDQDRERNIRKWFVDQDLIEGVLLLPENLFYNTTAAGVIVVLNKRKAPDRRGKIVLLNASKRFEKGRPKNYLPDEVIGSLAASFLSGEPVDSELAVISRDQAESADYNLSPSRWIGAPDELDARDLPALLTDFAKVKEEAVRIDEMLLNLLGQLSQ
jgi:type I restriction enzyme M protein